jgi:hypothetical protein
MYRPCVNPLVIGGIGFPELMTLVLVGLLPILVVLGLVVLVMRLARRP